MFQVQQRCTGGWCPVAQGMFRTPLKAVTAARCQTAQHGIEHRVVDLSLKAVIEVVAKGAIQHPPDGQLRSGFLRQLSKPLDERRTRMSPVTPPDRPLGRRMTRGMQRLTKREKM